MLTAVIVLWLLIAHVAQSQRIENVVDFECPEADGFFPHESQCDLYYKCENDVAELKLCGDGLAFDSSNHKKENCDYLFAVDCSTRPHLQPAAGTSKCPRLYGIFADEENCDVFWNCWNGEANRYQCSPGLAFDKDKRVCMWADQVPECKQEGNFPLYDSDSINPPEEIGNGFRCPVEDAANFGTFTRHAHPEDCRKFYVCIENLPREYGCPIGTVFKIGKDNVSGFCTDPENVPDCEDYYGDLDIKALKKSQQLESFDANSNTIGSSSVKSNSFRRKKISKEAVINKVQPKIEISANASSTLSPASVEDEYEDYEYGDKE